MITFPHYPISFGFARSQSESACPWSWGDLRAYWLAGPLTGGMEAGSIVDFSGNGNSYGVPQADMSVSNWVTNSGQPYGPRGYCLDFGQADNEFIVVPRSDSIDITGGEFTVLAWTRTPDTASEAGDTIYCQSELGNTNRQKYALTISSTERIRAFVNNSQYDGNTNVYATTGWKHVGVRLMDGTLGLFYNGVPDGSHSVAATLSSETDDAAIGAKVNGSVEHEGCISHLMVYGRGLSDEEILSIYYGASPVLLRRRIQGIVSVQITNGTIHRETNRLAPKEPVPEYLW